MSNVRPTAVSLLHGLNPAQLQAVQFSPNVPVQILAGPGSGKTKVLTSRIAYMILQHSISPSSICAVTFTNRAANEMRERLKKLIGPGRTNQLKMGTFHALCARFLRIHATLVGLDVNFTICDADESRKIISTILKQHKDFLEEKSIVLTDSTVQSMISKAKSKGEKPSDILKEVNALPPGAHPKLQRLNDEHGPPNDLKYVVGLVYEEYELTLKRNNSLDFDDLLLYGVKLFAGFKQTISWCKHVLVDEFQDTNTTQYSLMTALGTHRRVTVVGDPDQSIYGWRSAEVENLSKMCRDFSGTQQVLLEQNYRSTSSILKASLAIVSQDKNRIPKSLHTSHPAGSTPFLHSFSTEHAEALFIAIEIKKIIAHMGGALTWGDVAILLRFNALSRIIEQTLQKHGIPSRVLGGHRFFERQEVKNILAYLQLVDNPDFSPALIRASNMPARGIGEKTLQEIAKRADESKVSQLSIMEGICDGRLPDMKPTARRKLSSFVSTIRKLREAASKGTSPANLIRKLVDIVGFEDHLKKTQPDWESRWENVKELITFASEVATNLAAAEEQAAPDDEAPKDTPLRSFLQASMLSSEGDNQSEEESKDKVTISTCHAAKGLEWPVVMIPSAEDGTFPFARSEDEEEERRLLYVACTRAQGLLYLSHSEARTIAGKKMDRKVSPFISVVQWDDPTLFTDLQPTFLPADRQVICNVLNRPVPAEAEIARCVAEFERTTAHHLKDDFSLPQAPPQIPVDLTATFTSSSTMFRNTAGGVLVALTANSLQSTSQRPLANPLRLLSGQIGMITPPASNPTTLTNRAGPSSVASNNQFTANSWPPRSGASLSSPGFGTTPAHTSTQPAPRFFSQPFSAQNNATTVTPARVLGATTAPYSAPGPSRPRIDQHPVSSQGGAEKMFTLPAKLQLHPLLLANESNPPQRSENVPPRINQPSIVAPPAKTSPAIVTPPSYISVPQGTKRRLGMGHGGTGYCNKKFKPPT